MSVFGVPDGVRLRSFADVDAQREAIYQDAADAFRDFQPLENATHRLEIVDVGYDRDYAPTLAEEKKAIMSRQSLQRPLRGTIRLVNVDDGKVLDEQRTTLAHIPHLNRRGLFVRKGVIWSLRNQERLRSGVYARQRADGAAEAQFNVQRGRGFRIALDPKSGQFRFNVGQSTTQLYPILRALGVTDEELRERWGDDLYKRNYRAPSGNDRKDLLKVARKMAGGDVAEDLAVDALREALGKAELDEETTEITLGRRTKVIDNQTLLDATQKVLRVSRGEAAEDVRDAQQFQTVLSAEDFMRERLKRDQAGALRRMLWKASRDGKLGVNNGVLNKNIDALFDGTGLAAAVEDINPVEIYDQRQAITRMGEGGIRSEQSVSRAARGIQPSYLGIIDFTRGPECYDDRTEVLTVDGWKHWAVVDHRTLFACQVDGVTTFCQASELHRSHYCGMMYGVNNGEVSYLVTPNHRVHFRPVGTDSQYRVLDAQALYRKSITLLSGPNNTIQPTLTTESYTLAGTRLAPSANTWCVLLGAYLRNGQIEGDTLYLPHDPSMPANQIVSRDSRLNMIPVDWEVYGDGMRCTDKSLATYLRDYVGTSLRSVPRDVFRVSYSARRDLMQQLSPAESPLVTSNWRLLDDAEHLLFTLGQHSVRQIVEVGETGPTYRLQRTDRRESVVGNAGFHFTVDYNGEVYCATVPGGLLYVRREGGHGFWSGNSGRLGLDMRVTDGAMKGSDGKLYTPVRDAQGEIVYRNAVQLSKSTLALPGELGQGKERVVAVKDNRLQYVKPQEVDYELPSPQAMFSRATNMIPYAEGIKGQRLLMGSRFTQQALPLAEPEAPLVQTLDGKGENIHRQMGESLGAVRAKTAGVVTKVEPDFIELRTNDGIKRIDLYNHYPTARKTELHNTPLVSPGQTVSAGDVLAKSNFTDDQGVTALGRNLRAAWVVAEGDTIEDAFVLSDSAARKMAGQTSYRSEVASADVDSTKLRDYRAIYTDRFKPEQYNKLDEDGVVKIGQTVETGDPLILGFAKKKQRAVGAVIDSPRAMHTDMSEVWDHEAPGIVTDVVRTRKGIQVQVSASKPMAAADKLATRFGAKGVIARVVPDEEMPVGEDGKPMEILINALGITSRTNPAAMAEAALGKVAAATGKTYDVSNFSTPQGVIDFAYEELRKAGLKPEESLYDPKSGRTLPQVFTGNTYVMQLHHMAESKLGARDTAAYTMEGLPAKGGGDGSKRVGTLDVGALLASGSTEFLRDAKLIRGQRNDDYWRQVKSGGMASEPNRAFANEHFMTQLKGAGVNIKSRGSVQHLAPLLDADVDEMASGEITTGKTFDFETMKPIPGGLFDPAITGGADGTRFARITLPERVPHPLFIEPIQQLLGLTGKEMEAVLRGESDLNGRKGPAAVAEALKALDIDREIERHKEIVRSGRKTKRDKSVKALNHLAGLKKMGVAPDSLLISKIPVVPPKFRPVSSSRGLDVVHDLNYLYNDLLEAKNNYAQAQETFGDAGDEYMTLMKAVHAVSGMHEPVSQTSKDQAVKGILKTAIGVQDTPKAAAYQRKVVGSAVDTVGRGVITSDPNLDMDQVGVPREMAWKIFRPYTIRNLVTQGYDATRALQMVDDRHPQAERAMLQETERRPVVYNRAPALHQYNYVAGYAKIRDDDAIGMSYVNLAGLGGDYDGNCVSRDTELIIAIQLCDVRPWAKEATLRAVARSEVLVQNHDRVVARIQIGDLPHNPERHSVDKNGASVYEVPEGLSVLSYDHATGRTGFFSVTSYTIDPPKPVVRVITQRKREVTVTDNESLVAFNHNTGDIDKITPRGAEGRLLPAIRKTPVQGVAGSRELGWLIGAFAGDGCITNGKIGFTKLDGATRQAFAGALERICTECGSIFSRSRDYTGTAGVDKLGPSAKNHFQVDAELASHFERAFYTEGYKDQAQQGAHDALFKRLPPLFGLSEECRWGVLAGLIDTDGLVSLNCSPKDPKPQLLVNFATPSQAMRDDIIVLCRTLGVHASYTTTEAHLGEPQTHDSFTVSISVPDIAEGKLYLTSPHKAQILADNMGSVATNNLDFIPVTHDAVNYLCSPDAGEKGVDRKTWMALRSKSAYPTAARWAALAALECFGDDLPAALVGLNSLAQNRDVTWDPISSVEDVGAEETFDIGVPDTKVFAVNGGLIVQDTINIHVPAGQKAVEEVKRTLLPSKNLFSAANFRARLLPVQDYVAGLYAASTVDTSKKVQEFKSEEEAMDAYKRGKIGPRDPIRITG